MNVNINVNILYALSKYFFYTDVEIDEIRILNKDNVKLYTTNGTFLFHFDNSNDDEVEVFTVSDSIAINKNTRFTQF